MSKRAPLVSMLALATMSLILASCGLGRDEAREGEGITNPIVAATVNGRPIYVEDVRAYAVTRGWLQETEDLAANSDAFYMALEELIEIRLFSMEAEARGLDREPVVRRQLENARERVLASAIYEEIDRRATDPEAIERLYRENMNQLGQGEEVLLRHIVFESREAAEAAKRRLDQGERFEALAFELSVERDTAPDGGDLGFRSVADLTPTMRREVERTSTGALIGPIQLDDGWHIFRVDDRRTQGAPSLETLRPRIVAWLRWQETTQLNERLSRDARIERLRQPEEAMEPSADTPAPADAETPRAISPTPDATPDDAPPFPFPMGPGGVTGSPAPAAPAAPNLAPPAAATPAPASPADEAVGGPAL